MTRQEASTLYEELADLCWSGGRDLSLGVKARVMAIIMEFRESLGTTHPVVAAAERMLDHRTCGPFFSARHWVALLGAEIRGAFPEQ